MRPAPHLAPLARLAAVLVAVALSGVPRVVGALAPPERHQCRCGEHGAGQECTCPICRRAAAEAMAGDASQPPCHRARARASLAEADRPGGPPGAPCLTGSCGALDPRPASAAGVEPFILTPRGALLAPPCWEPPDATVPRAGALAREPELPPPRLAERPGMDPARRNTPTPPRPHPGAPRAAR